MATGVGFSFDTSFLKNLELADKRMSALMDKSNTLASSVTSAFQKMSSSGVVPFIKDLETRLNALNDIQISIGGKATKEFKNLGDDAADAATKIRELLEVLKQSPEYKSYVDSKGDKERYELWLMRKHSEAKEHKRVEDEKTQATIDAINRQNEAFAAQQQLRQQNQQVRDNAVQARANYEATIRMYEQMWREIDAKEKEKERRYLETQKREEEAAARKAKNVIDQANRELEAYRNAYKQRQQMYEQMWREIERRESANRRANYNLRMTGGNGLYASDNALRYADRIYSDRGLRSVDNMQKAIQRMQQAQNRLNLNTEAGKRKYEELGQKIKQVEKDLERLNTRAKSFGDIMKKVGYSVGVYFSISAMKNFGKKLVDVTKEFERQKVALQNLLQNKDEANRLWEKTVALAIKSPYTTQQLVTYTKQLAAYRIEHDKLYETTKMLADVSSGLGVEMSRMILAFGQVKAATYLRATELRQFTEAGVNMLDELARLYTELEGVEVKAGDVFERITKRQVVFSDVEEVFERLTSKGGMFFRMQETQAQTLYGQWANLQDIYQVSLDEMGRSVRGGMVFVISTLRTLVENWRLVATAIESVGAAWVAIKIGNWIATLKKADRTARMLAVTFGNLRKIMLSWQGAVGVLGVLVSVLYNYFSNLSQVNQRYVDLRRGTIDNSIAFEQLAEKVEKNNVAIEMYDKLLKDSTKTEEEINNIQKERNKIIGENNKLLAETKSKYEDLLPYVQENANGTLNFDKAIQVMQNRERAYLILQQKAKATLLRDALDTNIGDWRKEYNEAEEALIEYQTKLNDAIAKGNIFELQGDQLVDLRELYKYIKDVKSIEEFQKALSEMPEGMKSFAMYNKYAKELRGELGDVVGDFSKVSSFFVDNAHVVSEALHGIDKDLTLGVGEAAEIEQKKAGEAFDRLLERLGVVDEEAIKKIHEYVNSISKEKFNIVLDFNYKTDEERELLDWQKRYNEFIEKLTKGKNIAELRKISSFEIETDNKIKELDEYIKDQENIINRGGTKGQQRYTQEEIDKATELLAVLKEARNWFGKNSKETKKEESEELKRLKEQIRLVRQLADDYEEMWKKYGKAYADANIKSDARRNSFAELELDIDDFVIGTRQDEKNNLGKLLEKAIGIEGGKVEVEKAVADVEVEVRWDLQEQANANLSREFENLFGNYELSLELEKLNIPPDLANQLFGIDSIDLTTLRKELLNKVGLGDMVGKTNDEILNSNAYTKLHEHQRKELAAHLQKVSQMEQKEQEERLKKYIAFSRKAMSERAKIKFEELQTIAEIEKAFAIKENDSEEVKATKRAEEAKAKAKAKKDANDALQKLDWEDFKSSDTFNNIFDDLDNASDEVLKKVINRLKDFKAQWKDMPFDQMRQVVDLLQKAEEALKESDNPFTEAKRLKKAIKEDGRSKEQAQLDVYNAEQQKAVNEQALANYELFEKVANKQIAATTLTTEQLKEYVDWQSKSADEQKGLVEGKKIENAELDKAIQKGNTQQNNIKKLTDVYKKQEDSINQINKLTQDLYGSFMDLAENGAALFGKELDDTTKIFADMGASMADTVMQTVALYINLKSVETGAYAAGNALNTAMGVIGWIVMGVQLLSQAFKAIFDAHDNGLQKQIDAEAKSVERLQKAYEDLEEQIKNTYDISELNSTTKAAQDNLLAQISATERMIDAEEDKKKSDQDAIDGYKDEIDNLKKQYKELEETRLQELGAFATDENKKSGAEAFLDAWMEAYKQTGDGLSGLNEQFDEFFEDSVKRQMLQKATSKYLDNLFNKYDSAISDWAEGDLTDEELNEKLSGLKNDLPALNENLKKWAEATGIAAEFAGKDADLSGLQAGIQGITEDQADILAAYWSNVSLYTQDTNQKVNDLVTKLFSSDTDVNPMLSQLQTIAEQTSNIKTLLSTLTGNTTSIGGERLKVYAQIVGEPI